MARLELFLFGPPRLEQDGRLLEIDARKSMALLAYLAVTGERHSRETLLALLWPELEPRRAQNVLRRNLSVLNKTLKGSWLVVERDIIGLDLLMDAWLDVAEFRHLADSWRAHSHPKAEPCTDCLSDLAEAVALYRADFLAGFSVRDSPNFDDWQLFETEQFKRELGGVLERLVRGHSDRQDFDSAISYAQRWLALDPLQEPAHRQLMRLYAQSGNRSAALQQYQSCLRLLEEELDVPPQAETTALYQRLQQEADRHRKIIAGTFAIIDGDTEAGLKNNLLGYGGMGHVYRGFHIQSGDPVAIKVLKPEIVATNPDLVERFVREGETLRRLNHPNIVKMLAASEQDGQHFLVMEYVGGGSLHDLIKQEGPLPISLVLDVALDLADALTRAHRLNIIHRDLKPANVLLAEDGTPRLTDFGLARQLDVSSTTETGVVLGTIEFLSPEGCEGKRLDERADIWAFGVILFEMLTGRRPFTGETVPAVLSAILTQPLPDLSQLRSDIPAPLIDLIGRMLVRDPARRIPSVRLVGAELEAMMAERPVAPGVPVTPAGPPPPCPYRGLFAFREEDAPFFFGREAFTRQLVEGVHKQPLLAIVGPSGSGKSSVVFAGLIAQLRQDGDWGAEEPGSREDHQNPKIQNPKPKIENRDWLIADFRPGSDPFQGLAASLLPHLEPDSSETERLVETRNLAQSLKTGKLPLVDVVERILQKRTEARRFLLVADQFEELYTLCPEPEIRHNFIDVLLDLVELQAFQPAPTFTFVFTLRADFLEQALAYRSLADVIQDADFMLGPMTGEELSRAVESPAEKQGVFFETRLVERILDDVGEEPGNLPLLEFALTSLWERLPEQPQTRLLSHRGYETIGRVEGALTRHADQVYAGLQPAEQQATRRILTQLVRPGEGTEDTRRVARRVELSEADWSLVQRLADSRLVVTGRDAVGQETVEVVHEALIRSWGQFRRWMEDDRTFRSWQERLRAAMRQWTASEQDEGAFLRGVPLAEAEGWLAEREADLSPAEQTFIQAGLALRERRQAEREQERLARERLRRRITRGLATGLVIAMVLLALAGWQWWRAEQQRQSAAAERDRGQMALSRQLAALALTRLDNRLDLALLLSVESARIADTAAARGSLLTGLLSKPRVTTFLIGHTGQIRSVAFSPNGQMLASGSEDGTIILWDVATRQPLGPPLAVHTAGVRSVAFSPDGQILASGSVDNTIILWDVATKQRLGPPLTGHEAAVWSVAFSPDGQVLASGSGDSTIILWDVATGQPFDPPLSGHTDQVYSLAFSPDGQRLVSGSWDNSLILWDVSAARKTGGATGQPLGEPLTGHMEAVWSVAFSPDGRTLASGNGDGTIILWDTATGQPLDEPLTGHTEQVNSLAFSPDGQTLVSGGRDNTVILWDVTTHGPRGETLTTHTQPVWAVAFSPDGQTLASGGSDNKIILWKLNPSHPLVGARLTDHIVQVWSVYFSSDGQTLASGSSDGNVILWDVATGQPSGPPLTGHTNDVWSVAISPDGQTLASGSMDSTIILWDVATGQRLGSPLNGHTAGVRSVAFSPDGQTLASSSDDHSIILWDVATRQPLSAPLTGHKAPVMQVTFSPDGQTLASGSDDRSLILWDRATGQPLGPPLTGHIDFVNSVAFSPDGQILASGSWDNTVILWDVATGQALGSPLSGHTGPVADVAFSPNGRILASSGGATRFRTTGGDKTIILWDVATGQPLGPPLAGHTGNVFSVAFSPNGHILASSSEDSTVILWDMSLESWRARACGRASRNLTRAEWQQFFRDQPYRATCPDLPVPNE